VTRRVLALAVVWAASGSLARAQAPEPTLDYTDDVTRRSPPE
jgi:hypothetical protein